MESQKNLISISCPLHPSEFVQRVTLDQEAEQQLYCFECILQRSDNSPPPSNLKTIKDFLDIAATHYVKNKRVITPDSQVPAEYMTLLSEQSHHLEELSIHIEEEKKKVESTFSKITEEVLSLLNQKKAEYLYSLDQQLFNLRYWYIFFDKQVKRAHPTEEDMPFLFPSKEDLVNRVQKISNATQLMAFVRNIQEDLNEKVSSNIRATKKDSLDLLYKRIQELQTEKPEFDEEFLDISPLRESLKKFMSEQLEKTFVMKNSIDDVKHRDYPESQIITADHFKQIKSWLPKEFQNFYPKLIYRATRDGKTSQAFHSHCDAKGATVTLIKAKVKKSKETCLVGGFLDQNWVLDDNLPIVSSKAFIFSLTYNVKCPVINPHEAAYGYTDHGPIFGAGYDLAITDFKSDNSCAHGSYEGSEGLFQKPSAGKPKAKEYSEQDNEEDYEDCDDEDEEDYGETYFRMVELEVYTVK